jgi:hypothetical protein
MQKNLLKERILIIIGISTVILSLFIGCVLPKSSNNNDPTDLPKGKVTVTLSKAQYCTKYFYISIFNKGDDPLTATPLEQKNIEITEDAPVGAWHTGHAVLEFDASYDSGKALDIYGYIDANTNGKSDPTYDINFSALNVVMNGNKVINFEGEYLTVHIINIDPSIDIDNYLLLGIYAEDKSSDLLSDCIFYLTHPVGGTSSYTGLPYFLINGIKYRTYLIIDINDNMVFGDTGDKVYKSPLFMIDGTTDVTADYLNFTEAH